MLSMYVKDMSQKKKQYVRIKHKKKVRHYAKFFWFALFLLCCTWEEFGVRSQPNCKNAFGIIWDSCY